jgi:hypothetical protein
MTSAEFVGCVSHQDVHVMGAVVCACTSGKQRNEQEIVNVMIVGCRL